MTPEGAIRSAITTHLKAIGLTWFPMHSGMVKVRGGMMHLCPKGTADLLIFKAGRVYWCEIKNPKDQKRGGDWIAKQTQFRERVLSEGHYHARCESVQDVITLLES